MKEQAPECLKKALLLFYTSEAKHVTWLFTLKLAPTPYTLAD